MYLGKSLKFYSNLSMNQVSSHANLSILPAISGMKKWNQSKFQNLKQRLSSMGGETSKIRRPKSAGTKKSTTSQSTQKLTPEIKKTDSIGCTDNLLNVDFGTRTRNSSRSSLDSNINRSRSGSICSSRSNLSRQKHPISSRDRHLIQSCFQNPHEIIGHKILQRANEKRNGFANFYNKLSNDERDEIEEEIKVLLKKTVANINFIDEVQRLAEEFGGKHVKFRALGFKPDFFGAYADATITECIFLDNAIHPAHHVLTAFSSFITMVFSSVRDGFYAEMRRMRRASNSFSTGSNSSCMRKTISGDFNNIDSLPRSASPGNISGESDFSAIVVIPADNDTS